LLGLIYIFSYIPFVLQIKGLLGSDGVLPIKDYLPLIKRRFGKRGYTIIPTLFWFNASDAALLALCWSGVVLGCLLMLGICPALILFLLYVVQLSLASAGQDFLSFGWETFILELTVGAFLIVATTPLNVFGWLGLSVLLLRFHFQAGLSKIQSRDRNWRNLTALSYHYLTQPLPNTQAWYFDKLPMWFHKASALIMFYAELIVPWFIFSPPEMRLFVFTQLVGLQFVIWFTGNLSFLNHMTVVSCIVLIHNKFLGFLAWSAPSIGAPSTLVWQIMISALGAGYLFLQVISLWQSFYPIRTFQKILEFFYPYHLAYPHGIFAVMTTKRYEIVVEGSEDGQTWKEYEFYFKPGDLRHRPRRISPFQPRLDWQAWFLPFGSFGVGRQAWFSSFLVKLLEGSKPVLKLLKTNPFPEKPPKYVRALAYDYTFTTFQEKSETGNWWKRTSAGNYSPPLHLKP